MIWPGSAKKRQMKKFDETLAPYCASATNSEKLTNFCARVARTLVRGSVDARSSQGSGGARREQIVPGLTRGPRDWPKHPLMPKLKPTVIVDATPRSQSTYVPRAPLKAPPLRHPPPLTGTDLSQSASSREEYVQKMASVYVPRSPLKSPPPYHQPYVPRSPLKSPPSCPPPRLARADSSQPVSSREDATRSFSCLPEAKPMPKSREGMDVEPSSRAALEVSNLAKQVASIQAQPKPAPPVLDRTSVKPPGAQGRLDGSGNRLVEPSTDPKMPPPILQDSSAIEIDDDSDAGSQQGLPLRIFYTASEPNLEDNSNQQAEKGDNFPAVGEISRHNLPAAFLDRISLKRSVENDYEWKLRENWLARALKVEEKGGYSQDDIYLLNWLLVGDCGCFKAKPLKEEGAPAFQQVWQLHPRFRETGSDGGASRSFVLLQTS